MDNKIKIASHVLYFNQDKWILKHIEMVAPYVDKIYVAWSDVPWIYNTEARKNIKNDSDLEYLKQSKYFNKIEIITGTWKYDEDERNSCLEAARRDNINYLLIIDADEFYSSEDLEMIIEEIKNNPDFDVYNVLFTTYWKDLNHILVKPDGNHAAAHASVAINVKSNCKFVRCRNANSSKIKELPYICWHASYVLTDEECWSKINSWGHSHQFDKAFWYNFKWLRWTEDTIDLHPIYPHEWYKAIKNQFKLPEILNK